VSTDPLILGGDTLLTMDAANRIIGDGAVLIRAGRIEAVGPLATLTAAHPTIAVKRVAHSVLLPGLINAHAHSGLMRGTAEQLPVWDWLRLHIDPMHRVLEAPEAEIASWLCYAESALGGTTTVVDMWRFMEGSARAAQGVGTRLVAVPYVGEHPDYDYFETLDANESLIERWHGKADGRINVWVGLEHPFYADAAGQRRAIDMAKAYRTPLHTHCSESQIEVPEFAKRYGRRPMFALDELGFFEAPLTLIAHAVWLDATEIELIARRSVGVSHNPVSNMKLASGFAPVAELLAAGIPVGLGTDGEKENNNFDLFEEMKVASLLGKLRTLDATAMDSWQVLRMATSLGAKALGLEQEIGSLEPGKRADVIAVRTDTPRMTPSFSAGPYFNLQHNLVHAVRGQDVTLTMVNGRIVVEDGILQTADLQQILTEVQRAAPALFARRAAYLAEHAQGTPLWTRKSRP
jgi:5-methylthioadenosine/S-adenosylhomocysteine deaminase